MSFTADPRTLAALRAGVCDCRISPATVRRRSPRACARPDAKLAPGRKPDDHPDANPTVLHSPQVRSSNRVRVQYQNTRTHPDAKSRNTLFGGTPEWRPEVRDQRPETREERESIALPPNPWSLTPVHWTLTSGLEPVPGRKMLGGTQPGRKVFRFASRCKSFRERSLVACNSTPGR